MSHVQDPTRTTPYMIEIGLLTASNNTDALKPLTEPFLRQETSVTLTALALSM